MKKLTLLFIILFSAYLYLNNACAQEKKHSIRVGLGANITKDVYDQKLNFEKSLYTEYVYKFNKYISSGVQINANKYHSRGGILAGSFFTGSLKGLVRPLAFSRILGRFETGIGLSYELYAFSYDAYWMVNEDNHIYKEYSGSRFGIDFPFKIYFIDSGQFELAAFYSIKTFFEQSYYWGHSNIGLMFGVKF